MAAGSPVSAVAWCALDMPFERAAGALARRPGFWWLDSAQVDGRLGRFSFAGAEPAATLELRSGRVVRRRPGGGGASAPAGRNGSRAPHAGQDPLAPLRALQPPPPADAEGLAAWPFVGGLVGAFGYELGAALEEVPTAAGPGERAPDAVFHRVEALVAHDAVADLVLAIGLGLGADLAAARAAAAARLRAFVRGLGGGADWPPPAPTPPRGAALGLDGRPYLQAVERIRERIAEGDLYQACLTHRIETPFAGDALRLHLALRRACPAPFAAFLRLGDVALVSSSPERFLRVAADGAVESRPIKGTRPRGATPDEDARLRAELAASEKDRAENLMIVDLVRNDLGRVCTTGSVEVPELFALERYANVHQLVSTVRGRLAPGRDALDAVAAAFPPGSMTGAPKLAAMALLAALEPVRRGLYAGALGYLDARGRADLSVVIRTAFVRPGRLAVHTGGGIVADSEPRAEWEEACAKARAVLEAARAVEAEAGAGAPARALAGAVGGPGA